MYDIQRFFQEVAESVYVSKDTALKALKKS
jgi:hypothetical protein